MVIIRNKRYERNKQGGHGNKMELQFKTQMKQRNIMN